MDIEREALRYYIRGKSALSYFFYESKKLLHSDGLLGPLVCFSKCEGPITIIRKRNERENKDIN